MQIEILAQIPVFDCLISRYQGLHHILILTHLIIRVEQVEQVAFLHRHLPRRLLRIIV